MGSDLEDLIQRGPPYVERLVNDLCRETEVASRLSQDRTHDFNWLGLAEATAFAADVTKAPGLEREWRHLATRIYDCLAGASGGDSDSLRSSAMAQRIAMMRRFGVDPADSFRDPRVVIDWFNSTLPVELWDDISLVNEGRLHSGARITKDNVKSFRRLRRLKNHLTVLRELAQVAGVELDLDLNRWLAMYSRLP